MTYSKFLEDVEKLLTEALGENHVVICHSIPGNNGVVQDGISIQKRGEDIAPVIYLRPYFEEFTDGMELSDIVKEMIGVYKGSYEKLPASLPKFETFETAKERVAYKLVRQSGNEDLLNEVPYTPYLDLALVYYLLVESNEKGRMTALIRNEHMMRWGITPEILYEWAKENTPRLLPASIRPILDVICDPVFVSGMDTEVENGVLEELREDREEALPLFVLTNRNGMYGAICMLYDGVLEQFAKEHGADVIILPSSVHETLLIPRREGVEHTELQEMVRQVNKTLFEEDVLSENIYIYRRESKQTNIVT